MKRPIRVAVYSGKGANPRKPAQTLRKAGFALTRIGPSDLVVGRLDEFDVLYLPGGWYSFDKKTNRAIVAWVKRGGGCVGSCAGSYLVAGYIPIIPGRVLRANLRGRIYVEPQNGTHPILRGVARRCTRHNQRRWEPIAMPHMGGPLIFPKNRNHIVASYDWEGTIGAIVAARIGRGRSVAIAPHPEYPLTPLPRFDAVRKAALLQGDITRILPNAVRWAAGR